MQRESYRQNATRNGVDPTTGEPLVALYLQQFDVAWPQERIGEWVRHHRPDVFAEASAIWDQVLRSRVSLRETWRDAKTQGQAERPSESGLGEHRKSR